MLSLQAAFGFTWGMTGFKPTDALHVGQVNTGLRLQNPVARH